MGNLAVRRRDRAARVFADPSRVHRITHHGAFLDVEGYHLAEPSPQRTPVLHQAGASGRGRAFAGCHVECVFISARGKATTRAPVRAIRAEVAAGRRPEDVKIFVGIAVIPGRTRGEAEDKRDKYLSHASPEAGLAHCSASTGIDFARFRRDEPIPCGPTNAIQSPAEAAATRQPTKRDLLSELALGDRLPVCHPGAAVRAGGDNGAEIKARAPPARAGAGERGGSIPDLRRATKERDMSLRGRKLKCGRVRLAAPHARMKSRPATIERPHSALGSRTPIEVLATNGRARASCGLGAAARRPAPPGAMFNRTGSSGDEDIAQIRESGADGLVQLGRMPLREVPVRRGPRRGERSKSLPVAPWCIADVCDSCSEPRLLPERIGGRRCE